MKKLFTILSAALLVLSMGSCRGPMGPMGPQGPQGEPGIDGWVNRKVIDLDVKQNEWGYTDPNNTQINNYFFATFKVPELTWDIYDNGIVKVYREYNTGTNNATQIELPYTKYCEIVVNEANFDNGRYFYQEHIDYELTNGELTIFFTASDFDYENSNAESQHFSPEDMHFRLIMMW